MALKEEQETTVTWNAAEKVVYVYTAVPKHIRRLEKDSRAKRTGGNDEYGTFTIPMGSFDPLTGFRRTRVEMTPENREKNRARLAEARSRREATNGDA